MRLMINNVQDVNTLGYTRLDGPLLTLMLTTREEWLSPRRGFSERSDNPWDARKGDSSHHPRVYKGYAGRESLRLSDLSVFPQGEPE